MKLTTTLGTVRFSGILLVTGTLVGGPFVSRAAVQGENPAASVASVAAASDKAAKAAPELSSAVKEILTLVDAGISKDVIKIYIENLPAVRRLNAADLVALKERGVPDEIATALMKRGTESSVEQANRPVAAPAIVQQFSSGGELDPDSYDFFFYHYAYPRALSYSYQRLARYQPSYYSYPGVVYPYGVPSYGLSDRYRVSPSLNVEQRFNRLNVSGPTRSFSLTRNSGGRSLSRLR